MESLSSWDHQLFLFLNNLGSPQWDDFWAAVSYKWTAIPLYALLLYLIFRQFGWKVGVLAMIVITLLITSTDQLANVFKHGFERLRPCRQPGVMEYARMVVGRCGSYGFYSAHASSATALAVFLGALFKKAYPWMLATLLFWAVLVSYSRIYLGVHYPGDVLVGMLMGTWIGFIYFLLLKWLKRNIEK